MPLRLCCPGVPPLPLPPRNRPAGPSSASSSPWTRGPAGKLDEGDAARRKLWDLVGNNSWGRRCGLLCAVSLFSGRRLLSERAERGRQMPSWSISTVSSPPPDSGGERYVVCVGGGQGVAGSPTPASFYFLYLSVSFLPLPARFPRLCALTGARVYGDSSTVLTNNSCKKGEGAGADRPTD